MTRNPLVNAIAAESYILLLASVMNLLMRYAPPEDTILAPILAISIFTLSAAVMGYIFLTQPIELFMDKKRKEAVTLFGKTTLYFGLMTIGILGLVFVGAFK